MLSGHPALEPYERYPARTLASSSIDIVINYMQQAHCGSIIVPYINLSDYKRVWNSLNFSLSVYLNSKSVDCSSRKTAMLDVFGRIMVYVKHFWVIWNPVDDHIVYV